MKAFVSVDLQSLWEKRLRHKGPPILLCHINAMCVTSELSMLCKWSRETVPLLGLWSPGGFPCLPPMHTASLTPALRGRQQGPRFVPFSEALPARHRNAAFVHEPILCFPG